MTPADDEMTAITRAAGGVAAQLAGLIEWSLDATLPLAARARHVPAPSAIAAAADALAEAAGAAQLAAEAVRRLAAQAEAERAGLLGSAS